MVSRNAARDQLHTGVKLRGAALVALKAQGRIAADLTQLCELCQYLNALRPVDISAHLLQLLFQRQRMGRIKLLLFFLRHRVNHGFQLVRKVF